VHAILRRCTDSLQCPIKIQWHFTQKWKKNPEFLWNYKRLQIDKANLGRKEKLGQYTTSNYIIMNSVLHKDICTPVFIAA
jgi:hypothetical protein